MTRLGWVVLAGLLSGCSQTNIAELVKAMGNDPATFCATAVYAGASLNVARTNITNGRVTCNPQGLTVESEPAIAPIAVKVTPVP